MTTNLIQQSLNALGDNLNSSFSGQISDFLQLQGINTNQILKPLVDISETDEILLIQMIIAGVDHDSIDVSFFNNSINIQGERKPHVLIGSTKLTREINYGKFERKIIIPVSVTKKDSVTVDVKNGVLTILIDKTKESLNKFSLKLNESV
uniref:SHSP domain-containing protein n=1 Tax=viral metagenome TaxID=1070528 RepID=A0A6C0LX69_9ZZZZ